MTVFFCASPCPLRCAAIDEEDFIRREYMLGGTMILPLDTK